MSNWNTQHSTQQQQSTYFFQVYVEHSMKIDHILGQSMNPNKCKMTEVRQSMSSDHKIQLGNSYRQR